jgi:hypothetical protein
MNELLSTVRAAIKNLQQLEAALTQPVLDPLPLPLSSAAAALVGTEMLAQAILALDPPDVLRMRELAAHMDLPHPQSSRMLGKALRRLQYARVHTGVERIWVLRGAQVSEPKRWVRE